MTIRDLNALVFHIRETSAGRPDLLEVSHAERSETLSTTEFLRSVHSLALALEARGLRKGDRVAIFSENRPEWHIVDLACHLLGAPTVPLLPGLPRDQLAFVLRNSGCRWVFFSGDDKRKMLLGILGSLTVVPFLVPMEASAERGEGVTITSTLLMGEGAARLGEVPIERFRGRVDEDDLASIIYTSGTTDDPKGVMLGHRNFVSNILACAEIFPVGPEDSSLSFLPLSHVFQRTVDYLCFYRGLRIHYVPFFDDVPAALRAERPTVMAAAPAVYERAHHRAQARIREQSAFRRRFSEWALAVGRRHAVASREGLIGPLLALQRLLADRVELRHHRERFGGRLRFAISGGAPLAPDAESFFEAIGIPILQGYGLTETSPVLSTNRPESLRPGSVGKPISDVELRIAEDGEILVRGPGVMQGYWQNETATAASVDNSGWFRTGDLGRMDKSGYIFITDRKRHLLVLEGGEKVAPRPIEMLLVREGLVSQAVLVGEGRPWPGALLVPSPELLASAESSEGEPSLRDRVQEHVEQVNEQLPESHRIRAFHLLDRPLGQEEGELTPTFELRRRTLHQRYAEVIEGLYSAGDG